MSRRGDLYALTGAVLFGVSGAVAADAFASFEPIRLAQLRSVGTALFLGALAYRRRRTATAGRLPELMVLGAFLAADTITFYWAIERLGVGPGVTIQFLGPILVLVWMRLVQRRRVPGPAWVAAATAVAGTALVTRAWDAGDLDLVGVVAALGAAVTFAGYLVLGERVGRRLPGLTVGAYAFAMSALLFLVATPFRWPQADSSGWAQLAWITVAGTCIPFLLELAALRRVDPGRVGVIASVEPVVAAGLAWVVVGQALAPVQLVGALVVVISVAAVQYLTSSVAPDAPLAI